MANILVIYQTFGGKTKSLAEAAAAGATSSGAETEVKEATSVGADDLSNIDGVVVATTQSFRSMSGDTKKMFERLWIGRDKIRKGLRLATIVSYMNDAKSTQENMRAIGKNFGFQEAGELAVKTDDVEDGKLRARQLGIALAQGG